MRRPLFLSLFLALPLTLAACSDDDPVDKCTQQDSNQCATTYATCNAGCGAADQACLRQCQLDFCSCMDKASCDPPQECKTDQIFDANVNPFDGGTPQPDSDQSPDDDMDADDLEVFDQDAGTGNCTQDVMNSCSTQMTSCSAGCGADAGCLDQCQNAFCSCMRAGGCDPGDDCSGL